jgi:hypothetical protein
MRGVKTTYSEVLVSVEWHDCDDLVFVSDRSDEIRDVVASPVDPYALVLIPGKRGSVTPLKSFKISSSLNIRTGLLVT